MLDCILGDVQEPDPAFQDLKTLLLQKINTEQVSLGGTTLGAYA
jgi:hypothetical protein